MAHEAIEAVALIPIKPEYANAIMRGAKKVEFRKVKFQREVSHVVVYASNPVKRVLGYFAVSDIKELSPGAISKQYKDVGGICHDSFRSYYGSRQSAIAIEVGEVRKLALPVKLSKIKSGPVPQSFSYLNPNVLERLERLVME